MPDDTLLQKFLDTTITELGEVRGEIAEVRGGVRELAQTVYGVDRKNGMRSDIQWIRQKLEGVNFEKIAQYEERIKEVETFKTATEATAKWREAHGRTARQALLLFHTVYQRRPQRKI